MPEVAGYNDGDPPLPKSPRSPFKYGQGPLCRACSQQGHRNSGNRLPSSCAAPSEGQGGLSGTKSYGGVTRRRNSFTPSATALAALQAWMPEPETPRQEPPTHRHDSTGTPVTSSCPREPAGAAHQTTLPSRSRGQGVSCCPLLLTPSTLSESSAHVLRNTRLLAGYVQEANIWRRGNKAGLSRPTLGINSQHLPPRGTYWFWSKGLHLWSRW